MPCVYSILSNIAMTSLGEQGASRRASHLVIRSGCGSCLFVLFLISISEIGDLLQFFFRLFILASFVPSVLGELLFCFVMSCN